MTTKAITAKRLEAKSKKLGIKTRDVVAGGFFILEYSGKTKPYIRAPFFPRWVALMSKLPYGYWQPARKKKTDKKLPPPIKIEDMHTMQLVNAIKWCLSSISKTIAHYPWGYLRQSKASILAQIPAWQCLLIEGRKRKLKMIGEEPYLAEWFQACWAEIVFREM